MHLAHDLHLACVVLCQTAFHVLDCGLTCGWHFASLRWAYMDCCRELGPRKLQGMPSVMRACDAC